MDSLRKLRDVVTHHDHSKPDAVSLDADGNALPEITDNIAFNAAARAPEPSVSKTEKVKGKLKSVKHAVAHPHQAAKQRGQKQLLKTAVQTERPWLGGDQRAADAELFEAYDELEEHRRHDSHHDSAVKAGSATSPLEDAKARVDEIEEKRTELEVVWHLSRYVRRARVVRRPLAWPPVERYREVGEDGKVERMLWLKWVGHVRIPWESGKWSFVLISCVVIDHAVWLARLRVAVYRSDEYSAVRSDGTHQCGGALARGVAGVSGVVESIEACLPVGGPLAHVQVVRGVSRDGEDGVFHDVLRGCSCSASASATYQDHS